MRALAEQFKLPVAAKPDSQDICFIPSGRYVDLVRRLRPEVQRAGDIVHVDGTHLGRHDGLYQFTIGQRRGLGVFAGVPLYVVGLDVARARLIVGRREDGAVRRLWLRDVNMLSPMKIEGDEGEGEGSGLLVKLRSTQAPVAATLRRLGSGAGLRAEITLQEPENGIAAGQACVFYQSCDNGADDGKQKVIGGGWIEETDLSRSNKVQAASHQANHRKGEENTNMSLTL